MPGTLYRRSDIGYRYAKDVPAKCAKWGTDHSSENVSSKFEAATQRQNVATDHLGFDRPMTFSPDSPLLLLPILTLLWQHSHAPHTLKDGDTAMCVGIVPLQIRGNDTPSTQKARAKP